MARYLVKHRGKFGCGLSSRIQVYMLYTRVSVCVCICINVCMLHTYACYVFVFVYIYSYIHVQPYIQCMDVSLNLYISREHKMEENCNCVIIYRLSFYGKTGLKN